MQDIWKKINCVPEDLYVPLSRRHVAFIYSGAVCIPTGMMTTGLPCSSQIRVVSVYHLIIDKLIWHEVSSAYCHKNILKWDQYVTPSIRIRAGFMFNGCAVYVLIKGSMIGRLYIEDILLPYFLLFRGAISENFRFMEVSVPCHRTWQSLHHCID